MELSILLHKNNRIAGTTLRDKTRKEKNNMGLHVAKNMDHVMYNRQELATYLGIPLDHFVCAEQTHSDHFCKVTQKDKGKGAFSMINAIPDTDGLYTYEPNIVLCTFSADCVPVLLYHELTGVIAAIHSGWQGTIKEITRKVLQHLIQEEQHSPEHFHVILGAALSQEKFEVDEDVYCLFKNLNYADDFISYNKATDKYHINNQLTIKKQCELEGVPSEQITLDQTCTYSSTEHFSYRQDNKTGRHLSFIVNKQNI